MSATELERRLTDVLHRQAEEAMSRTQTEERLVRLLNDTRAEKPPARRWLVGGLVAAAAAGLALAGWLAMRDPETSQVEPAGSLTPEQVATDYLRSAAAYDLPRAESYLSPDADLHLWGGVEGWRATQLWNQATLLEIQPEPCVANTTQSPGTSRVECPYSYTGLGSKELGLAPYVGSSYVFTVHDGQILTLTDHFEFQTNRYNVQVWEPFAAWVGENHPQDFGVMYTDGGTDFATTDESIALWRQHLFGYIAEQLASTGAAQ